MPSMKSAPPRGFALPLVIAVIAMGGLLVTGSFLLGRLESQAGSNGLRSSRAFEAAEAGLAWSLSHWDPQNDTLTPGASLVAVATASWQTTLRRLSDELFQLRTEAALPIPGASWQASRHLGLLVRWTAPIPGPAALTATDSIVWDGSGHASGYSQTLSGWPSCPLDSVPGLRVAPAAVLDMGSCLGPPCLEGLPPFYQDSLLNTSVFTGLAPVLYSSLAGAATRTPSGSLPLIGPVVNGGVCDLADPSNWGEPNRAVPSPCTTFFPVIHAAGDLTIGGGRGQGTLLIDGNLVLQGGFEFAGLVVVRGQLMTGAGGAHVTGQLISRSLVIPAGEQLGVDYSACVLRKVLRGPAPVKPLMYRSWAQLY